MQAKASQWIGFYWLLPYRVVEAIYHHSAINMITWCVFIQNWAANNSSGVMAGGGGADLGQLPRFIPLNFFAVWKLPENLPVENGSKMYSLNTKIPFLETLGAKSKFWAPIISCQKFCVCQNSIGNLQYPSKIATLCTAYFFQPTTLLTAE